MTDREDREGVYRAIRAHSHDLRLSIHEAASVEAAMQLRRIGNSLEKIEEVKTSIAISLDRIAAAFERAYPPGGARAGEETPGNPFHLW